MATITITMLKAKFRTAFLQREVYYDATVSEDLEVLEMVKVTEPVCDANGKVTTPAKIEPAATVEEATHIVAQSDISATPYEHVPTELGRYDTWNFQTVAASDEWKHVALYKIYDLSDLVTRTITKTVEVPD